MDISLQIPATPERKKGACGTFLAEDCENRKIFANWAEIRKDFNNGRCWDTKKQTLE